MVEVTSTTEVPRSADEVTVEPATEVTVVEAAAWLVEDEAPLDEAPLPAEELRVADEEVLEALVDVVLLPVLPPPPPELPVLLSAVVPAPVEPPPSDEEVPSSVDVACLGTMW